jgi:hypothetical protein
MIRTYDNRGFFPADDVKAASACRFSPLGTMIDGALAPVICAWTRS